MLCGAEIVLHSWERWCRVNRLTCVPRAAGEYFLLDSTPRHSIVSHRKQIGSVPRGLRMAELSFPQAYDFNRGLRLVVMG